MSDGAEDLLQACLAAQATGPDFPTISQEKLHRRGLVAGSPEQKWIAGEAILEVRSITGARLRFGTTISIVSGQHRWLFSLTGDVGWSLYSPNLWAALPRGHREEQLHKTG